MSAQDLTSLSATELSGGVARGTFSAEEVAKAHLSRIAGRDGKVKAFLKVLEDAALAQARVVDKKRAAGLPRGKLAGVPGAIKDNINVEGVETTCASKILK